MDFEGTTGCAPFAPNGVEADADAAPGLGRDGGTACRMCATSSTGGSVVGSFAARGPGLYSVDLDVRAEQPGATCNVSLASPDDTGALRVFASKTLDVSNALAPGRIVGRSTSQSPKLIVSVGLTSGCVLVDNVVVAYEP